MKKILAVILALTMVLALAACGAAPATVEPAPEAPDPLKSEMPSKIYEESAAANPEGKTVNILLVIDMQKDFVDQALGTAEAQAIVPNVVAKINEYKARGGARRWSIRSANGIRARQTAARRRRRR